MHLRHRPLIQFELCVMVFDQWKREDKVPYSWDTIISTLEAVGENSTATKIRDWLAKP